VSCNIKGHENAVLHGFQSGRFHHAGLRDDIIVQVGSVTLGVGKPLFPRRVLSPVLRLTEVRRMGEGLVELRYNDRSVAGESGPEGGAR
jgi:hypothetical protein